MTKETGGAAFPSDNNKPITGSKGMTLRDYFAAKAMQALIASPRVPAPAHHGGTDVTDSMIADLSYKVADAMLEARK
jgi:hypothetical protein